MKSVWMLLRRTFSELGDDEATLYAAALSYSALFALAPLLVSLAPGVDVLWQVVNLIASLGVIALLFALIFQVVPDAEVGWRGVWVGARVTAVLWSLGPIAIGLHLGQTAIASEYGAAGSLVVLLAWIYYSALILLAGAEFTQVYPNTYSSRVRPGPEAVEVRRK